MKHRNGKGQYSSPPDKQISEDMEELLGVYLQSLQQQKSDTSDSTIETRRREVRYWLAFCEQNDINPLSATTDDVRGYIQTITDKSDTTIGNYYASVQSFYSITQNDQAHERLELENRHPCHKNAGISLKEDYSVHQSTPEYRKQHSLSAKETDGLRENSGNVLAVKPAKVEMLFDNVPGKTPETRLRNEIACRLNWYTGCRSVELSRLKIQNIDWENCAIDVKSAKIKASENPDLVRRHVFFPEEFKFQLKRWCERVRHGFSSQVEPEYGAILCTTHSKTMDGAQINDIVKQAAHNAGVQRPLRPANPERDEEIKEWFVTTHRIRRSAISYWVNDCEAIDLHQAQLLAGHARLDQTMEYVEDDEEQLSEDYQRAMS